MFHWAWGILKRRPSRSLIACGLALMAVAAIHLQLIEKATLADRSLLTSDMMILAVFGDAAVAFAGFVMFSWGSWRMARGRP